MGVVRVVRILNARERGKSYPLIRLCANSRRSRLRDRRRFAQMSRPWLAYVRKIAGGYSCLKGGFTAGMRLAWINCSIAHRAGGNRYDSGFFCAEPTLVNLSKGRERSQVVSFSVGRSDLRGTLAIAIGMLVCFFQVKSWSVRHARCIPESSVSREPSTRVGKA